MLLLVVVDEGFLPGDCRNSMCSFRGSRCTVADDVGVLFVGLVLDRLDGIRDPRECKGFALWIETGEFTKLPSGSVFMCLTASFN